MANAYYERGSSFNPDELADGDAIEAEFDSVARGFDTIEDLVNANQAGYPEQTFHVAPATLDTHAVPKAQMETALSFKLDAVNYNATDILSKLKTVDGTDSGLDADYLDGQHGSYYRNADNINAGTLAKERLPGTIDSSTTGTAANAELLDGLDSTRFSRSAVGQLNNYDNWDTFTSHGTYKVNSPDFTGNANAPPSTYGYGILQVEVSEIGGENLTNQVYYPHNNDYDKYIYQRMLNGGIWTAWSKIWRGGTDSGLVAVLTGEAQSGDWLPIPAGYDESQCWFFISAKNTNPRDFTWYLGFSVNMPHYTEYVYLQNRQVVAVTRVFDVASGSFKYIDGLVNYIVIGRK